ncbi:Mu transposase C-terminal domain-containing protein [Rhodocyclus tenuis]|uniref:Mu transposase C-terminal domain-containing protein n=1 Tax=Rhodocyclus tenuis TaxID=1066 RepID=UPI001903EE8E|nr:Mu transposase C-terminal domain-containing protein [Rhodocyclus tenuis]
MGDETFCLTKFATTHSVIGRNIDTGAEKVINLAEISESFARETNGKRIDLSSVGEEEWGKAIERYKILRPLVGKPSRVREDVKKVAEAIQVSIATAYRYLDRIERLGTVTCLLRKTRADKGEKKLDPPVEKILKEVIVSEYLTTHKRSPTKALTEVRRRCRSQNLPLPCKSTLLRRIDEILPEEREKKRNGRNAALDYRAYRGSLPGVDRLHAIWQIDHTKVDLILVDEKDRVPIGRPWITVAIDVYSRTVVGWYISFDPPGTLGTGICISNAILPKDAWLVRLGVEHPWPCQGKPRIIQADNAKEFRGNTLKMACEEHDFDLKFRKVKKPNYGAHIERLLGTLLGEIHSLDGTTFSNPQEKGDYDSEGHAAMTLDEFERWLANLILGVYHHRKHAGLNCPPIKRYRDGIFGDENTPGIGMLPIAADPEKLRIDFLPFEERTIQPYGVVIDHIQYHDPVLDKWIGAIDLRTRRLKRKFIFRRDPRNISTLIFWDPDAHRYFSIPYRDGRRPAISLWELHAIQQFLAEKGKADLDEDVIFCAFDEMRLIEENSRKLTKKQRMMQERRRRHLRVAPHIAPQVRSNSIDMPPRVPVVDAQNETSRPQLDFSRITPFDEIEPM